MVIKVQAKEKENTNELPAAGEKNSKPIKVCGHTVYPSQIEKSLQLEKTTGYEKTPDISLEEIAAMIENGKITKDNVEDILDRVYQIMGEKEGNEEMWKKTLTIKRALREIKSKVKE